MYTLIETKINRFSLLAICDELRLRENEMKGQRKEKKVQYIDEYRYRDSCLAVLCRCRAYFPTSFLTFIQGYILYKILYCWWLEGVVVKKGNMGKTKLRVSNTSPKIIKVPYFSPKQHPQILA